LRHPSSPGNPTRPRRHRQDLRAECDPQTEREGQPATAGLKARRRQLARADGRHDAGGDGQHDERGQGHGYRDEEHGFGEGMLLLLKLVGFVGHKSRR
jgi:hypothetical protein